MVNGRACILLVPAHVDATHFRQEPALISRTTTRYHHTLMPRTTTTGNSHTFMTRIATATRS
eukprot:1795193-Rhodomonas_salina.1